MWGKGISEPQVLRAVHSSVCKTRCDLGSFLYKSEIFLHYCQPGTLKRRERETEKKDTKHVLTCAFDLLESESGGARRARHQDKEEPTHFFPEESRRTQPRESVLKSTGKFITRQRIQ